MIKRLLTIRVHRDRYYFGLKELLSRHTDTVKKLTENAPTLLPPFFDRLHEIPARPGHELAELTRLLYRLPPPTLRCGRCTACAGVD